MKILLIGSGGREHALAWKMSQSSRCEKLFIAPGNAGTAQVGENVAIDPGNFDSVYGLIREESIDLVVVGPEQPLVAGITDYLEAKKIAVIGPNKMAAQLEGSKDFSKTFMKKYGIPTAAYASFSSGQEAEAFAYLESQSLPIVIKASGLAAGKGVLICESHDHARSVAAEMLSGQAFGEAGTTIVVEEFLTGIEISVFVLTDGKSYKLLPSAKDYKRIGEGDTGLNTGGMGAVSPVPFADDAFMDRVQQTIVQPTLDGLQAEGILYKGFIFIGLMVSADGTPYLLEYNVRMGDPETEVVLPRLESDLVELFEGVRDGNLDEKEIRFKSETCTTVMLVSGGYPGAYEKGKVITQPESVQGSLIFHAGTTLCDGEVLTNGGRVIAVSSFGDSIEAAIRQSLENADRISFEGKYFRKDIGQDLMG